MTLYTKRPGFAREVVANTDPKVLYAEREIFTTFGDTVSVLEKGKSLRFFGDNPDVGTVRETVWGVGGNETYVTTNVIDTVSSSNASDTQVIQIEGHTVSGSGTSQQFTSVIQTATLNGQNKVVLTTPLARINRIENVSVTPLAGDVYGYEDDTLSGGVPTTATKIHIKIRGTDSCNASEKCATTLSNEDYFIMTAVSGGISHKSAASGGFYLETRTPSLSFKEIYKFSADRGSGTVQVIFDPYLIIPKNSDIRIRAEASASNTALLAQFQGYLAKVT